jgi:hypothetical protein
MTDMRTKISSKAAGLFSALLLSAVFCSAQAQVVKFDDKGKAMAPELQNTTILSPTGEAPMPLRVPQAGSNEAAQAVQQNAEAVLKAEKEAAEKKATEVKALAPKIDPVDKPAPPGQAAALKLYAAHKYPLAQKELQKFLNQGTANTETHLYLAYCYYYQRIYSKALPQFDWVGKNGVPFKTRFKAEQTSMAIHTLMRGICPGNCLKPGDSRWTREADGHMIAWWNLPNGRKKGFTEGHMGHIIGLVDGVPFDMGSCPLCGGTGTIMPLHDGGPIPGT